MTETFGNFEIIEKMQPMARRAISQIEAMEQAIMQNNRVDIEKFLVEAENAISHLKSDLELHDRLQKALGTQKTDTTTIRKGNITEFHHTDSDYEGTEHGVVMGVSRKGRTTSVFRPHRVF